MRRNDDPPDYVAFREAAINFLIHQDYGDQHRKASLKWFIDRFVFWNPGDAFATTAQLLESNEKEIRNPLIVSAFRRIGLSDQAGTGIRAIMRNWHELGRRTPEIDNDKAGKSFQLVLCQEPLMTEKSSDPASIHPSPDKYPTSTQQVVKALQLKSALSRAYLQEALGLADREHFSKEYLQPALNSGLIEMTIPDKPRSSKQQYRLTNAGKHFLASMK